ncbi:hypothetical protein DFH06DRAFT_1480241 [Mycena polygramma]|nr:hypothetical protein DFH06DRAFT_1480241 [Mycena polygramma]
MELMESMCSKCGAPTASGIVPNVDQSSHDFTHLLKSNEAPLDRDIPFICESLSNEQDRLAALNARIEDLLATVAQETERRGEAAERVRQHRAIFSSIRRLPPEILCEIFAMTLSSGKWPTAPWYLGVICRSWRRVALSYTPLWCSIITPSSLAVVETQLERSGDAPLRLFWSGNNYADPRVLSAVVAQCSRWNALHLEQNPHYPLPATSLDWLRPAAGRLVQLQTLTVLNLDGVPDVFLTAPAMREVVLTDRMLSAASPASDNIPWAQITHYRGKDRIQRQLGILSCASNLVECTIGVYASNLNGETVVLPRLRRLCVTGTAILDHLEAPALTSFTSFHDETLRTVLPFVQRSSCTLTKLSLVGCRTSTELITLLEALPTLTYLLLTFRSVDHTFQDQATLFYAMTIGIFSTPICPNLTSFLYGHLPRDATRDSFFSMVQSRLQLNSSRRLAYLRIFYTVAESGYSPAASAFRAQIATLRDGGLDAAFWGHWSVADLEEKGVIF